MNKKRLFAYALLAIFSTSILTSCLYAPKQPWTPKNRSHKVSKKKR